MGVLSLTSLSDLASRRLLIVYRKICSSKEGQPWGPPDIRPLLESPLRPSLAVLPCCKDGELFT